MSAGFKTLSEFLLLRIYAVRLKPVYTVYLAVFPEH